MLKRKCKYRRHATRVKQDNLCIMYDREVKTHDVLPPVANKKVHIPLTESQT